MTLKAEAEPNQRFDLYLCVGNSGRSIASVRLPGAFMPLIKAVREQHLTVEYTMGEQDGVQFPILTDATKKAVAAVMGILAQGSTPITEQAATEPQTQMEAQAQTEAPAAEEAPRAPLTDEMAPPPTEDELVKGMML